MTAPPAWLHSFSNWLTPRRIRAQAIVLAICLWSVAIADFSTSGPMDRAGNIKFQDFLVFYTGGRPVAQNRIGEVYDFQAQQREYDAVVGRPVQVSLPDVYGPQVSLFFSPWSRLPFLAAASLWSGASALVYFLCCFWIWRACPELRSAWSIVLPAMLGFPPFFHFAVRGQLSSLVLLCSVVALFAFRSGRDWLAGFALGSLVFKPQFLAGILAILIFSLAWKTLAGVTAACLAQLGLAWTCFGTPVMRAYFATLRHLPQTIGMLEPGFSQAQMHSLHSFWSLLLPWPAVSAIAYAGSSILVLGIAVRTWNSGADMAIRFSSLILATVLLNPHLFIYDLLAMVPIFFLLTNWTLENSQDAWSRGMQSLLYLCFLLPLFGPLAIWTHVQLSVIAFMGLLVTLSGVLPGREKSLTAECAEGPRRL
jgi:hypothetical protein